MLISHEIPKQLFPYHSLINDYPYLLAHLLIKELPSFDEEYFNFYSSYIKNKPFVVLDNSCYELGVPIDIELLKELAKQLSITHLIIPDAYQDYEGTMELFEKTYRLVENEPYKLFCVCQGSTYDQINACYKFYNKFKKIDIIGFNHKKLKNEGDWYRDKYYPYLLEFNGAPRKKIHFLGSETPYEFLNMPWHIKKTIFSTDTSAPIINGWKEYKFQEKTDETYIKPHAKLADNLKMELTNKQIDIICHNIKTFKKFTSK